MINVSATGLVYRNPKPYLRAIHTWHPSVALLPSGEVLAAFDTGQGAESLDYRTMVTRSADKGDTWAEPQPLVKDTATRRTTHTVRLGAVSGGVVTAAGARLYRDDPEEGLVNRANGIGYTEMDLIYLETRDGGKSWSAPRTIKPPLVGPSFETCHRIIELRDGRWLWPTSTWKDWNGNAPNGMKGIALVSTDRGQTWPSYLTTMDMWSRGVVAWEQSVAQLPDGRLLVVAWAFNEAKGTTEPTPYALSADGKTFSAPRLTGLHGQTAKILALPDGRVLCLYRRHDKPGLWANLSKIQGDTWVNLEETAVWQGSSSGMTGKGGAGDELSALRFGFPSMTLLPSGEVLAMFWCMEDAIQNIRWVRIGV
ncbi:MAG: sialidase family protein [Planctomycetota bacterium]|nr:sialidase family protein [Planctomycetota bacterium]